MFLYQNFSLKNGNLLMVSEFLPEWLKKKNADLEVNPKLNDKRNAIADFLILVECIWCISNIEYQERIWVRHEDMDKIVDSYDDTTMYFIEDADIVLDGRQEGHIEMTERQHQVLKKLYDMVDVYDSSEDRPESDAEIVADPKWHRIREYAKLVYEELTQE